MICVYSNILCMLVDQAKYNKCHWKFNHTGIVMKKALLKMVIYSKEGTGIITPTSHREDLFKQNHACHLGLCESQQRAKQIVYWPGLYDQFNEVFTDCQTCLMFNNNHKQPSSKQLGHKVPLVPWNKLSIDIFHFENVSCLSVGNRFAVFRILHRMTAKHGTSHMQVFFFQNMVGLIL